MKFCRQAQGPSLTRGPVQVLRRRTLATPPFPHQLLWPVGNPCTLLRIDTHEKEKRDRHLRHSKFDSEVTEDLRSNIRGWNTTLYQSDWSLLEVDGSSLVDSEFQS